MRKVKDFFVGGRHFKEEFRRQMRLIIIVTLAFTIAFAWRQTVFDAVQTAVQKPLNTNSIPSSILTSTAITIISLILIYITSQILKTKPDNY